MFTSLAWGQSHVGSAVCAGCHAEQAQAWRGSHHAQAMQLASKHTVLGRFDGQSLRHQGLLTRFFKRGERFFVRTAGADGREADFEISHTLGVYPLQQLLVRLPGGRLQVLGVAWDARPAAQGGQRWYHLEAEAASRPGEATHWSGREQNWNFQCAACHTTASHKGYDAVQDRYNTRQAELGVGCEACHGPGSEHLRWARTPAAARSESHGLVLGRAALRVLNFVFQGEGPIAQAQAQAQGPAAQGQKAGEVCQACHARRSELRAEPRIGAPFLDQYRPALISPGLYHPDGRIDGEVFELGSFLQSAMHRAGVSCGNCHDPHSGRLRAPGDALCAQCHQPARYAQAEHRGQASAARCVSCHMAEKTYMGVHVRHDHSLLRPGQSGRDSAFGRASRLADGSLPLRAEHSQSEDGLLRLGAALALAWQPPAQALSLGLPLLRDPLRAVRIEAARALLGRAGPGWSERDAQALRSASTELLQAEQMALERPEAWLNLAQIQERLGDPAAADAAWRQALRRDAGFSPARLYAVELARRQAGRAAPDERAGEQLLRAGLQLRPQDAALAHGLGRLLLRQQRLPEALPWLARAAEHREAPAEYSLLLVLALHEQGQNRQAQEQLSRARLRYPMDRGLQQAGRTLGAAPAR